MSERRLAPLLAALPDGAVAVETVTAAGSWLRDGVLGSKQQRGKEQWPDCTREAAVTQQRKEDVLHNHTDRDEYLATGILHMTNAVSFINNDCKMVRRAALQQSVVTSGGAPLHAVGACSDHLVLP